MPFDRKFNLKALLLLSFGHLATDIYQGALPALLPLLKSKLGLSYAAAGAILLVSNVSSSVIQPAFGFISDRREKPVLLPLGCLAAGVGFSLLAFSGSYVQVLVFVLVSGLGVSSYHPEGYKTASYFTGTRVAAGMSIFSVGGNLGFALGPILCLWLTSRGGLGSLPFLVVPSLLFASLALSQWMVIAAPRERGEAATRNKGGWAAIPWGPITMLVATVVFRSWTQLGLMTYVPFYFVNHLGGDPVAAGRLVSAFLLGGVVGTLGGSPLADRWGHKRYLVVSQALTALLLPLVTRTEGPLLLPGLTLCGMLLISTFTVTVVMAQELLPERRGVASGLMVGFAIGTGGIGVTLLGLLADRFGVPAAYHLVALFPALAFLASLCIRYPHRAGRPEKEGAAT